MTCEHVEVDVVVKDGYVGVNGDGADKAVGRLANGLPFPTTEAIQSSRLVLVARFRRNYSRTREQPPKAPQMPLVARR